jgi:hypothetical protein
MTDENRKRIIDAIALLEQVLRDTDQSIKSAAVLRALETAGRAEPPGVIQGGPGGGSADYGRERIEFGRLRR